jgi:EF-hand domain pair
VKRNGIPVAEIQPANRRIKQGRSNMISSIGSMTQSMAMQPARPEKPSPEEMFASLDVDESGTLEESELQTMIDRMSGRMADQDQTTGDLMAKLDGDGDGQLTFEEFEAGRPPRQGPPPQAMPTESEESVQTDLLQYLLDMYAQSEDTSELYAGVLA